MKLTSQGIEVDVPQGWDAEIYRRSAGLQPLGVEGEQTRPVVHMANFPLPTERGDYGSGAVEIMGPDHVLIVLFEFGPESVGTALFRREGTPTVDASDFARHTLQRTLPGQSGAQYFFNDAGRAFVLYVVLGSHVRRRELVPEVNAILSSLDLATF
jgi:hypothetical protein